MAAHRSAHPAPHARPGRRPDAGKHAAILLHARHLFAEHGFSGANMDVLAEAAGVSKPTIYLHFGSKASLFEAALHGLVDRLPAPAALVGGPRGTLPERLATIARTEEHPSELPSLMRNTYAVFCLKKHKNKTQPNC